MTDPLACQRHRFSLPDDAHYLNCAYMSPIAREVEEVGIEAMRTKRFPASITPEDFFSHSTGLRERFARLVGAPDPTRIAIHPAVSYGVATAATNLPVRPNQNIVLLHEQFPGNVYAWRRVAKGACAEIRVVRPPEGPARGAGWNERILDTIDEATAVVTVPTVHWTDGTRFELEAIGRRAREVGAALVVDGTQSVGALPFDVTTVRPDALIVAGYKWMMGPYSIALSYLGERFDDGVPLEETWIGRRESHDFQRLVEYADDYEVGAIRFDVGERSNFTLVPMQSRALDLILEWGTERIPEYCAGLTGDLLTEATSLGFGIESDAFRSPHLFGLYMPDGLELGALEAALEERNIHVSLRGSAMRVSPNVYNDAGDVGALIDALRAAAA